MYKKYFFYLYLIFQSFFTIAQTHWNPVNLNNSNSLNKIKSFNSNQIIAVGNNGFIVASSNGGDTWAELNSPTTFNLHDVYIESTSTFWVCSSNGKLYKTTNSGSSWATIDLSDNAINAIDFKNSFGIAVGNNGKIFKSIDAGISWEALEKLSIFNLNDVLYVNDTLIIVVGAGGTILKNINNEEEWTVIESNTNESLNAVEYNTIKNQILIGGNNGINIRINPVSFSLSNSVNGAQWWRHIHCSDNQICYWVGFNQMISLEEPNRQRNINLSQEENITSITFINLTRGYLTTTSGKIYETNTSGFLLSSIGIDTPEISVYPNPVLNFLHIQTIVNDFRIKVYDLSGKLVMIDQDQKLINFSSLPSNTYFIEIISSESVFRTKLIKL